MFLGPRISTVFTSRWKALAWAASVCLTAYCSIPSKDGSNGAGGAVTAVAGLIGAPAANDAQSHVSPWAPTPAPAN